MTKSVDELMRLVEACALECIEDRLERLTDVEKARAALRSALEEVVPTWRPIETAPRNGGLMLLRTDGGIVFVGKLNKHLDLWVDDEGRERFRTVARWMPLPEDDAAMQQAPEQEG